MSPWIKPTMDQHARMFQSVFPSEPWIGEVALGGAKSRDPGWGQLTPPGGPWWPCLAPLPLST
jgi:hypothetical protein